MVYSKRFQAEKFFSSIMGDLQKSKIKAVFSLSPITWNQYRGHRTYMTDSEVYILFENGYCLIIDYRFIDFLDIEYRKMTVEEQSEHSEILMKDFFNTSNDICDFRDGRICRTETCSLEYGIISQVTLRSVTKAYTKWINNGIYFVEPTKETFDEIRLIMSNGKSLVICADSAEADGYTLFWSDDTAETVTDR